MRNQKTTLVKIGAEPFKEKIHSILENPRPYHQKLISKLVLANKKEFQHAHTTAIGIDANTKSCNRRALCLFNNDVGREQRIRTVTNSRGLRGREHWLRPPKKTEMLENC